jgi:hypothetical protein
LFARRKWANAKSGLRAERHGELQHTGAENSLNQRSESVADDYRRQQGKTSRQSESATDIYSDGICKWDTTSVLSGGPSLATTATQSSPVGSYPITITQNTLTAADYTFSFVNGTLIITEPAPVLFCRDGNEQSRRT